MPANKLDGHVADSDSQTKPRKKKRLLTESKAAAIKYQETLKKRKLEENSAPSSRTMSTSEQPSKQGKKSPQRKDAEAQRLKMEKRRMSKNRALEYALKMRINKGGVGNGATSSGTGDGTVDKEGASGSGEDEMVVNETYIKTPVEPWLSPDIPGSFSASSRRHVEPPQTQWTPPMPTNFRRKTPNTAPAQLLASRKNVILPPNDTLKVAGRTAGQVSSRHWRAGFLGNATGVGEKEVPAKGFLRYATNRTGEDKPVIAAPPQSPHDDAKKKARAESVVPASPEYPGNGTKEEVHVERVVPEGVVVPEDVGPASSSSHGRPIQGGGVTLWARTCVVALVPLLLSCLIWGVLIPGWPGARRTVVDAWNYFPEFGANTSRGDKCFLSSGQDPSVCKEGTKVTECPSPAVCGLGRILSCDIPFDMSEKGDACIMSPAVMEEVNAVVDALRKSTVKEQCKVSGLLMPSASKNFITLAEAAATQERKPLSILASMPPGNIVGLIDLREETAQDFRIGKEGNGGDDAKSPVEGASERVARLSEAVANAIRLPWGCRARLFAGRLILAQWKIVLSACALVMTILYLDFRSLRSYKQHAKVCAMRDECYKTLLDHTAKDSLPMQMSHIQDFVGDKWRARGDGNTAKVQKNVRELWALVEKEVEHDTRIRRSYRNVRGQYNVPCWEWKGPSSTSFENIGVLEPGTAPRPWLLWWLNQPVSKP